MEPTTQTSFMQRNMKWIIVVAVIVIIAVWAMGKYNYFITANEAIDAQWAQVENQYQRRFDLIPNLIGTVKGLTQQELAVVTAVTEARTRYAGATTTDQKAAAAGQVESSLGRLLVIAESYPQIASAQSFRDLMTQLEGTENRISVERMKYNDLVRTYNSNVKTFPSSILAGLFGKSEHAYFEVTAEAQANPKVDFSTGTVPVGTPTPANPAAY